MKSGGNIYKSYLSVVEVVSSSTAVTNINSAILPINLTNIFIYKTLFPKDKLNKVIRDLSRITGISDDYLYEQYTRLHKSVIRQCKQQIESWGIDKDNFDDVASIIYEKYITKKESGAYYTDKATTSFIILNSLLKYVFRGVLVTKILYQKTISPADAYIFFEREYKNLTPSQKRLVKERLLHIKILDPTCGTGAFLLDAATILLKLHSITGDNLTIAARLAHIFRHNIYGVDIDQTAIAILKFRIYVLFRKCSMVSLLSTDNIKVGNALLNAQFDWSANFETVFNSGGFDCIVGNPPYLELSSMKDQVIDDDFLTMQCGNLYAMVLEKSLCSLSHNHTEIGFIIPLSFVSTMRMKKLRELFQDKSSSIKVLNYADRPSCLFNGVHQKLTILFATVGFGTDRIFTSKYTHWLKSEFNGLYNQTSLVFVDTNDWNDIIPKVGSVMGRSILKKISDRKQICLVDNAVDSSEYNVWVNMRMCFWAKAFTYPQQSNEYKVFSFKSPGDAALFSAILNSSLFFFVWEAVSDCWHITLKDLNWIKINFDSINTNYKREISQEYRRFECQLENNKKYIGSVQIDYIYQHKYFKQDIDRLDELIAPLFGLSRQELDFIKSYQESYRINSLNQ